MLHATSLLAEYSLEYVRRIGDDRIILVKNLKNANAINKKATKDAEEIAREFLSELFSQEGGFQGLNSYEEDLELTGVQTDQFGLKHVRYRQLYKGEVPVYATELVVRLRRDLSVNTVSLFTIPKLAPLDTSVLSLQDVERIAKEHFRNNDLYRNAVKRQQIKRNCKKKYPEIHVIRRSRCFRIRLRRRKKIYKPVELKDSELFLYSENFLAQKEEDDQRFVWDVQLANARGLQHERYLIDAGNGEIVRKDDGIRGLNRKIYDASRTNTTLDLDYPQYYGGPTPYYHGRSENIHTPRGPLPMQGPMSGSTDVDDYYNALGDLHTYYQNVLLRDGANNLGGLVTGSALVANGDTAIYTHIDNNIGFGQECQNKHSFSGANFIAFCSEADADDHDSLGHEYAHFLARNMGTSPGYPVARELSGTGESGAILEAIADFYGEAFERYESGSNDWIISSTAGNGFERHLSDPTASTGQAANDDIGAYPEHYSDQDFYCGKQGDPTGIYANSLVMSKAFHLMVEGTGDSTYNGCHVEGIGFQKVEFLINYALNVEFATITTFNSSYGFINNACAALVDFGFLGFTQADCDKVRIAMQAVQIDQPGICAIKDCTTEMEQQGLCSTEVLPATCAEDQGVEILPGDYDRDEDVDYDDYLLWADTEGNSVTPGAAADGDSSGTIDEADYIIWRSNVGAGVTGGYSGDYNRDGRVDAADYGLWKEMFGSNPEAGYGADGNGDGKVNLADYTVWRNNLGAGVPQLPPGDYDEDGDVDADDYARWKSCFGSEPVGDCKAADGNKDGSVNLADYTIWRNNLGAGT